MDIGIFIFGVLILPAIIYFTVRGAVQEGVFNALVQYEKYKNEERN